MNVILAYFRYGRLQGHSERFHSQFGSAAVINGYIPSQGVSNGDQGRDLKASGPRGYPEASFP